MTMQQLDSKPELRYCHTCNTHTPQIIIKDKNNPDKKTKKFCLVCCKKSKITEKDISQLDSMCEYCSSNLGFLGDKNRSGRRFCRNGRCATNQNKFMKAWNNQSVFAINKKISELRKRLVRDQNFDSIEEKMKAKLPKLSNEKIGIIHNQIAMLYNIKQAQKILQVKIH